MIVTSQTLKDLMTGFKKHYQDGFRETESQYQKIATVIPSSTASNTYAGLGDWPELVEWIGDRQFKNMKTFDYTIKNKDWESSIEVKRTDIEDDNLGIYAPRFQAAGRAAKIHPDRLVFNALKDGMNQICFDGQNFFDTDHPIFPNVDGTGTAKTVSNFYTGTGPAWYLLDTSQPLKPMIYQNRKDMTFTSMTADTDEAVFMRNMYRYGIDGRSNVGFGFWQMAACSKEDLTADNFEKVYDGMCNLEADGGRPLDITPTMLIVPPTLRSKAEKILKAKTVNSGDDNTNFERVELVIAKWVK